MFIAASELLVALAIALSAGMMDVAVALLDKPRGFETLTALAPPILATAALVLAVYLVAWAILRPVVASRHLDRRAAALSLAAFLGTTFALALLAGLQTLEVSPHSLFRAGIVLTLSLVTGVGVYATYRATGSLGVSERADSLALALPVLVLEVLLFEWLEVYGIDDPTSVASILLIAALLAAVATTAVWSLSRGGHRRAVRMPAAVTVLLVAGPLAGFVYARQSGTGEAGPAQASRVPPRVIIISVDTLRADALSTYRPGAGPTAAIDAIADDGVLFERATAAAPWTLPSLTSIMSGLLPAVHQTINFTSSLSSNVTTLAEYLNARGYHTAAVVHNDLLNPKNNLWQGFDEYLPMQEQWFANAVGARLLSAAAPTVFPPPSWPSNDDQTRIVTDWLDAHQDQNFFLWVHYFDPHAPYAPPAEYLVGDPPPNMGRSFEGQKLALQGFFVPSQDDRRWIRSLYDAEVRYIDANVGRVIATLKRLNLYDDSLLVFTSDHGEEFWEHGGLGHGHSMYNELLRVPLIVKMPKSADHGRVDTVVSTASVTPTILDIAGIRYPADDLDVPSLLPLIDRSTGTYVDTPVVSGAQILFDRHDAVTFDGFKYIVSRISGREELYDLGADPSEQHSIAASDPARLETGRRLLREQLARAAALRKRLKVEEGVIPADEDTVRRLRTLGYLQ